MIPIILFVVIKHNQHRMSGNDNRMEVFELDHAEWYRRADLRQMYRDRTKTVRGIKGFGGMSRSMQCLSVQMYDQKDWDDLFGRESLLPELQQYVDDILRYNHDETETVPFTGHLEVSLLLEDNAFPTRRGVHLALFLIYATPHKQFRDGHIVGIEFGEGSHTQQVIQRIFDVKTRALIQEITQYDMLTFLATDDEMNTLLYEYFLQDFTPKDYGLDPERSWHSCCHPDHKERFV